MYYTLLPVITGERNLLFAQNRSRLWQMSPLSSNGGGRYPYFRIILVSLSLSLSLKNRRMYGTGSKGHTVRSLSISIKRPPHTLAGGPCQLYLIRRARHDIIRVILVATAAQLRTMCYGCRHSSSSFVY